MSQFSLPILLYEETRFLSILFLAPVGQNVIANFYRLAHLFTCRRGINIWQTFFLSLWPFITDLMNLSAPIPNLIILIFQFFIRAKWRLSIIVYDQPILHFRGVIVIIDMKTLKTWGCDESNCGHPIYYFRLSSKSFIEKNARNLNINVRS